ncbi:MAG: N-acetyl-gamma-glutamyl-phosphate reductase [Myxococcota bacterium]
MAADLRIGLVGARGHVGGELVRLLENHPRMKVAWAATRSGGGQRVGHVVLEEMTPEDAAHRDVDAVVLALPNGQAASWVSALDASGRAPVVVDLSADMRFTDTWVYGLPELNREKVRGARRISNPGCYATGMQLGLAPLRELLAETPHVFGVSGYSGAGTTPSDKNDPEKLKDNLMPYSLVDHTHEREVTRHLGHPIHFMPHVASHFRGITLTISTVLRRGLTADELHELFSDAYRNEPLVQVVKDTPWVSRAAGRHDVTVGGFTADAARGRAVVVVTLDNLLKGAATQALQNLNLALGVDELTGIPLHGPTTVG